MSIVNIVVRDAMDIIYLFIYLFAFELTNCVRVKRSTKYYQQSPIHIIKDTNAWRICNICLDSVCFLFYIASSVFVDFDGMSSIDLYEFELKKCWVLVSSLFVYWLLARPTYNILSTKYAFIYTLNHRSNYNKKTLMLYTFLNGIFLEWFYCVVNL